MWKLWRTGQDDPGKQTSAAWPLAGPRRRHGLRGCSALVLTLVMAWATIMVIMVFFEETLIFFPEKYPSGFWETEAVTEQSGVAVEDHFFTAADGVRLHAWWLKPPQLADAPRLPVLLLFHGNAGNLSHRLDLVLALASLPAEVVIIDYRGYGRSEGKPREQGFYLDSAAAWKLVTEEQGVAPTQVVLHGRSLGGAVAVELATKVPAAGLIVESSFTSIPAMASRHYPFVPGFLIRTRLDSASRISSLTLPKLFIHSESDEIVPFDHGRTLFDLAAPPKRFHRVIGGHHNNTWAVDRANYLATLTDFVQEVTRRGK